MIKAVYRTGLFLLHWFSFYYVKAQHNLSSHFKDTVTVTQNETTINTAANSRLSKEHVKKKTKVILYFHYGWDDFSQLWWTRQEQQNFYKASKDYNIAAIFTGHKCYGLYKMEWDRCLFSGKPTKRRENRKLPVCKRPKG